MFSGAAVMEHDSFAAQVTRRSYGDSYEDHNGRAPSQCGDFVEYEKWSEFPQWFKGMVADMQVVQRAPFVGVSAAKLKRFFDVSMKANVILFSQGSRFAASRFAIQSRPKSYYQNLLTYLNHEDPWAGYILELLWWYVIGGSEAPCGFEEDIGESYC